MTAAAFFNWQWVFDHRSDVAARTLEHLQLTGIAVTLGLALSLPLVVIALRYPRTYGPIAGGAGVLYTIPSLAAFGILIPIFGIRAGPTAIIPLAAYTLLILIRNIVTGLRGVPPEVLEAADGMGYTRTRRLWSIELPLALPVIVAGVRIATVTVIGLVTVTSLLGRGGLGFFILNGIRRSIVFPTEVILGMVLVVILAAAVDAGLLGVERALTPWSRRRSEGEAVRGDARIAGA